MDVSSNDLKCSLYQHSWFLQRKETELFTSSTFSILLNFGSPPVWPAETNIPLTKYVPFMETFDVLYMFWLSVFVSMKSLATCGSVVTWTEVTLETF